MNQGGYGQENNGYEPGGFYSNAGHGDKNDNLDGPVTEWYDHSLGAEKVNLRREKDEYLHQGKDGTPKNPSVPLAKEDRNFFERDNEHKKADNNYHGNLKLNPAKVKSSYYTNYNGKLVEKILSRAARVNQVKDVRTFVNGDEVNIAVLLKDSANEKESVRQVREAVAPLTKGRKVTIATDMGTFSTLRSLDNDLRDGGPIDLPGATYSR